MERNFSKPELELKVPDLLVCVVTAVGKQVVGEQAAVLIDRELLAAINLDQHGYDVSGPPARVLTGSIHWMRLPLLPVLHSLPVIRSLETVIRIESFCLLQLLSEICSRVFYQRLHNAPHFILPGL